MAIKKYQTVSDYTAAGYPTTESRVAQIVSTNEIKIDGVNVKVDRPVLGDAVYKKDGAIHFFKGGDALNHTSLVNAGYTDLGQIIGYRNGKAIFLDKTISSSKYLNVWQYAITAISSTNLTIGLWMKGDYATRKDTAITLTAAELSDTTASEITAALNESGNTGYIGYSNHGYWAYYDEDNSRIVVQCDICEDYRQYQCYASGGTIALCVWEDMPASSDLWRNKMYSTYYGGMNFTRFKTYYSTNDSTPTSQVPIMTDGIVNATAFAESEYCSDIRAKYGTYDNYMKANMVLKNQKYGVFNIDAESVAKKFADKTATKKDGTVVYKFPAFHHASAIDYDVTGLEAGDLYLTGVEDGMIFMDDTNMAIINATRTKMGHTLISNGSNHWFAQRFNVVFAWYFGGLYGNLTGGGVNGGNRVQGAALLTL